MSMPLYYIIIHARSNRLSKPWHVIAVKNNEFFPACLKRTGLFYDPMAADLACSVKLFNVNVTVAKDKFAVEVFKIFQNFWGRQVTRVDKHFYIPGPEYFHSFQCLFDIVMCVRNQSYKHTSLTQPGADGDRGIYNNQVQIPAAFFFRCEQHALGCPFKNLGRLQVCDYQYLFIN